MDTLQFKIDFKGRKLSIMARPLNTEVGLCYIVQIDNQSPVLFTYDTEYMTLMADEGFDEELELLIGKTIDDFHA